MVSSLLYLKLGALVRLSWDLLDILYLKRYPVLWFGTFAKFLSLLEKEIKIRSNDIFDIFNCAFNNLRIHYHCSE